MKNNKILLFSLVLNAVVLVFMVFNNKLRNENTGQSVGISNEKYIKRPVKVIQQNLGSNYQKDAEVSIPGDQSDMSIEDRIRSIAGINPSEAIRIASLEEDSAIRTSLFGLIASQWVMVDPESCFLWSMSLGEPHAKANSLSNMMPYLAQHDRIMALSLLDQIPKEEIKDGVFFALIAHMKDSDMKFSFDETLKRIDDLGRVESMSSMLVQAMFEKGMLEAVKSSLNSLPIGDFRESVSLSIIRTIGNESPESAMRWWQDNQDSCDKTLALDELAIAFSKKDPESGVKYADQLDYKSQNQYLRSLGVSWGVEKPEDAGKWLLSAIQESDYRSNKQMADGIIEGWIFWDQSKALESIRLIPDATSRDQAELTAAGILVKKDPAAAAGLLKPLLKHATDDSQIVLASVASSWLNRDPIAASHWIGGLEQGPLKDVAIQKLVENVIGKSQDYTSANKWAVTISDPKHRAVVTAMIEKSSNSSK